jgi:hypothetical protein
MSTGLVGYAPEAEAAHLGVGGRTRGRVPRPFKGRRVAVVGGLEALVGPVAAGRALLLHPLAVLVVLLGLVVRGRPLVLLLLLLLLLLVLLLMLLLLLLLVLLLLLLLMLLTRTGRPLSEDGLLRAVGIDGEEGGEANVAGLGGSALTGQLHGLLEEGHPLLALPADLRRSLCGRDGQRVELAPRLQRS